MERRIVLVSGAPGAGKTTLAVELAAILQLPLLTKDDIKETLWDVLEPPLGDLASSRRLGAAAMELLWTLAERCPAGILEANFRPHSAYERSRIQALSSCVVEVYCSCPPELAAARYVARNTDPAHHPSHVLPTLSPAQLDEFDRPMGIGPVVQVDTAGAVDIGDVAKEVLRHWPS